MVETTGNLSLIGSIMVFTKEWLLTGMGLLFFAGVMTRIMVYYTVKREYWFAAEFEKRADLFVESVPQHEKVSFYMATRKVLEKTFYELFEVRFYMKRRKPDFIMTWSDRVFLIKQGAAFLVHDILKNIKPMKFHGEPKLFQVSKKVLAHNPSFSKVLGVFPAAPLTDMINMLPGIFIVLGVFGTFLGIMNTLPSLSAMDLNDLDGTKSVIDGFLINLAFSMSTSLAGIVFSVMFSVVNSFMNPNTVYVNAVDRLESALDAIWNVSTNNEVPHDLAKFDENKSPEEVLASKSLDKQLHEMHQAAPKRAG